MKKSLFFALAVVCVHAVCVASNVSSKNRGKLSTDICRMMAHKQTQSAVNTSTEKVCAFVRFTTGDAEQLLARYGCEKVTQIGDIYIANIPLGQIEAMAAADEVERIEMQTGGRLMNDVTPRWVNSAGVCQGMGLPQGYDGTGVLLGIVDIGFDVTHPAFYGEDGTTYRIKGFVDDYYSKDETRGVLTPLGREYLTKEDILGNLNVGDTLYTHGTHTLGTAAGSGYGSPFRGMAYGADIFAISSKNAGEEWFANSADQAARMKRIFDYADQTGQPCVITYSIGFDDRPSESQLFSEALQSMLGPGRILVAAAGNSGYKNSYVHKPKGVEAAGAGLSLKDQTSHCYLTSEQPFHLKCIACRYDTDNDRYFMTDSVTIDMEALPTDSIELRGHHIFVEREGTFYTLADRWEDLGLGDFNILMFLLEDKEADVQAYIGEADDLVKIDTSQLDDPRFAYAESNHDIGLPGTLPQVVTVGAMTGRGTCFNAKGEKDDMFQDSFGKIAPFSSTGPTISGVAKPDVVAPGVNVVSAGNRYSKESYDESFVAQTTFKGRQYPWIALSGTSMATPCVAGIVALWLQADPTLTSERIKDIFRQTCRHLDETMDYPNNTYGHGLIDAYAGMLRVLDMETAIPGISTRQPTAVRIQPADGGVVRLVFDTLPAQPFSVTVYSVTGQLLASEHLQPNGSTHYEVTLPQQPHGVCAVQLRSSEQGVTGSELIRF